jgi:PhnB protein
MKLTAHINFGGRCEEAFRFYERCGVGAVSTMLKWEDSPMAKDVAEEWRGKICHATLNAGASELAGVDDPFESHETPKGFQMVLDVEDAEEGERVFLALAESGAVKVPMGRTFWAARYGIVVDRFGIRWEVNCGGTRSA